MIIKKKEMYIHVYTTNSNSSCKYHLTIWQYIDNTVFKIQVTDLIKLMFPKDAAESQLISLKNN